MEEEEEGRENGMEEEEEGRENMLGIGEGGQRLHNVYRSRGRRVEGGLLLYCPCCLQVISPSSEHLFQTLNEQDLHFWMDALQKTTAEALQKFETCPQALPAQQEGGGEGGGTTDIVSDAMALILAVPGNRQCADCTSTGEQRVSSRERGGQGD